ncbi:rhomboid family intramembrane serine protease [Kordia jejudonensis]|uniref:rhomboid family intramembrane serine protease n=1 Tax=Kordia jejudonensis TaxID=1348245 RepID=UPI00062995AE|nr:rhomboid family intramembrane serine protease [Kordia jejudonensis]
MGLLDDIKYRYARLGFIGKLIAINVTIFLSLYILEYLFKSNLISRWLYLPKTFGDFFLQPWSILSYSFLHGNLLHLAFNMIALYYIGRLFLSVYNTKRFLNVYFLGAIVGGCFFLLSYNIFPAFIERTPPLVGASAAIMAILIFIATIRANMMIQVFTFRLELWKLGAFFVILDLIRIPMNDGANAGGFISHLGGALLGYIYAKRLQKGSDIGSGFEKIMDMFVSYFTPKKKSPLKTVYKNKQKSRSTQTSVSSPTEKQRKIDGILDKISKSGYESLTKEEKDFLFKAGKEN